MPRPRQKLSEVLFLTETTLELSDEEAVAAYEAEFGKKISLDALRKRRQRLGIKKKGYNGTFEVLPRGSKEDE